MELDKHEPPLVDLDMLLDMMNTPVDECRITVTSPQEKCLAPNLLDNLDKIGMRDTGLVLGTGQNLGQAFAAINALNPRPYIIAVNGAVEVGIAPDARLTFDDTAPRCAWAKHYLTKPDYLSFIGHAAAWDYHYADYRFAVELNYNAANALCSLATVGGCALDLFGRCFLRLGKPSTVYLAGLDFGGPHYFNGYRCMQVGVWSQLWHMNSLIQHWTAKGLTIKTLSKTNLTVDHA